MDLELIHWAHDACRDIDIQFEVWFKGVADTKSAALDLEGASGMETSYVFSNFYSSFWLILANFERLVLGCIEAEFRK